MSTSRTITTTHASTAGPSRSRHIPPVPANPAVREDEDLEDDDEEARKEAEEKAARVAVAKKKAVQEEWARTLRAQQQEAKVAERHRLLADAAAARSQRGTSASEILVSPRRPVVEIRREKGKGRAQVLGQPVGGDPDNGDDNGEKEPCERCKAKKIPCLQQAGKQSSMISMETRMAMMGMGEEPARAGPSRRTAERRWRIVEESAEEEEEEEEKEVEEKEDKVEKDGEGEEETAPSEKGKERAE
ncbi:hypothetical protein F5051DRAFT_446829 [Lentinula edodes]|nr:hypothetical protein F5051DRAFT_446829 [Lentinula edodes]